ncbi:hypothetical protein ACOSQ4_021552 [Xanthoceras sorbifolium]
MELFPIQTTQIGLAVTNCYSMQFLHHIQDHWCLLLHQPRHFLKHGTYSPNFMQMARDRGNSMTNFWTLNSFLNIYEEAHADFPITANFT